MPLLHIAWLRFKPEVPPERIEHHLAAYFDHPAHQPVATSLKGDVAELRVMDLQV